MKLLPILSRIPHEALGVYIYLDERAELDSLIGVTQQEVSRATRLSVEAVRESLGWLSQPTYKDANLVDPQPSPPLISLVKYSKAHKISLLPPYNDGRSVRFTFEDTDSRRIAVLEEEVRRLARSNKQSERLSLYMKGDRGAVVAEIERDVGRPLTMEECFLLGGICEAYGPERLKTAWRRHAANLDRPIIAIYAMFVKDRFGKMTIEKEEFVDEDYPKFIRDEALV